MSLNIDLEQVESTINNNDVQDTSTSRSSLSLNLESVEDLEIERQSLMDMQLDFSDLEKITAAIGAGLATESVINHRTLDLVTEARALKKTVVRHGKITSKVVCPEGFKVAGSGGCERMSSRDIIAYSKRAKKAAKTRARRPIKPGTMKSRNRSMLVRDKNTARVNRIVPA